MDHQALMVYQPMFINYCGQIYKTTWQDDLTTLENSQLSASQKLAVVTFLPQKDKDRLLLKNWRPLPLLSTDYTLITKMLAMKLSTVLWDIIQSYQIACIKGIYIGENIITIDDAIAICKQSNMTGILPPFYCENAFDIIKWKFLIQILTNVISEIFSKSGSKFSIIIFKRLLWIMDIWLLL